MRRRDLMMVLSVAAAFSAPMDAPASTASALAWCDQHARMPSCPAEFLAVAPQCLASGFRSCLIAEARAAAAADNCGLALRLARACQCHSPATRDALDEAAVCEWLRAN
jgi:hypothetical protein